MDELRTAIASEATLGSGLMRPGTATADPAIPTIEGAYRSLEAWGFLAQPDLPDLPGPAFLLVALRPSPSMRHFDPELVRYWTVAAGRGHLQELTRRSTFPLYRPFAWGSIRTRRPPGRHERLPDVRRRAHGRGRRRHRHPHVHVTGAAPATRRPFAGMG